MKGGNRMIHGRDGNVYLFVFPFVAQNPFYMKETRYSSYIYRARV